MSKPTTITDVAERAGVTKATVSMVMRSRPGISEATRQRVTRIARELGYRPDAARRTRGPMRHGQVAFLMVASTQVRVGNGPGGSYLYRMLQGASARAEQAGLNLVFCEATIDDIKAGRLPRALEQLHLDGVLSRGWCLPEIRALLEANHVPFALVDCGEHVAELPQVHIENMRAMDALAEHLIAAGARRTAMITGGLDHINAQERLAGWQVALTRRGMTFDDQLLVRESGFDEQSGSRGVRTLLSRGVFFDALVCHNDLIALGASRELASQGLCVPEDVLLAGFDNMDFSSLLPVPLTTVDSASEQLGAVGMQQLLDLIEKTSRVEADARVPAKLVARESTQRPERVVAAAAPT